MGITQVSARLLIPEIAEYPEGIGVQLKGTELEHAQATILRHHYMHSVPSGKSIYVAYETALVVWSIPANCNIGKFLLWEGAKVWELSRLWAPDGHHPALLTMAISAAIGIINAIERPALLVSYADPNAGHTGGVYRAASWIFDGQTDSIRMYSRDGSEVPRRAFHSGSRGLTKAQIEALGFVEVYRPGKYRFIKPLSHRAKRVVAARRLRNADDACTTAGP
jgi:hypothetical protein